jgi:hypothetical protein
MNMDNLNKWLTLTANCGVLAGLVFLAVEIHDNNVTARVDSTLNAASQIANLNFRFANDTVLTGLYLKGMNDFLTLTPTEKEQFDRLMRGYLATLSGVANAANFGLVGGSGGVENGNRNANVERLIESQGFRDWWAQVDKRGIPGLIRNITDEYVNARNQEN